MVCRTPRVAPLILLPVVACATSSVVTPVRAWSLPGPCESRFQPNSYGQIEEDPQPVLIKDDDELEEHVECSADHEASYDFSVEQLAMFRLGSRNGQSFKALRVEDDGRTVTLVVETSRYCGGTRPQTTAETFFYRVPKRTRALKTQLVPANEPPCPKGLP